MSSEAVTNGNLGECRVATFAKVRIHSLKLEKSSFRRRCSSKQSPINLPLYIVDKNRKIASSNGKLAIFARAANANANRMGSRPPSMAVGHVAIAAAAKADDV